jgi:hypothetical protein
MKKASRFEYDRIQSAIDGLDAVATEMERKWGRGRLRLLVDNDMRIKFDRQAIKFNDAVWDTDADRAEKAAAAMIRGWKALDQAATAAGAKPLSPVVWETTKQDGTVIALVRTLAEASAVAAEGRQVEVWTIDEVARLSDATGFVAKVKQTFPGAKIVDASKTDIPFDDLDHLIGI